MIKPLSTAITAIGLFFLVLLLFATNSLVKLGIPVLNLSFGDLRLITSSASCDLKTAGWDLDSPSCDPWGRPFNLPTLWVRIFSFLRLTDDRASVIGFVMLALLTIALAYWLHCFRFWLHVTNTHKYFGLLCFSLLLVSPPMLLLAERANVDILIFAGLTIGFIFWNRNSRYGVVVLVLILGVLKIYPWAALLITIRMKQAKRLILFSVFGLLVGLGYLSSEIMNIRSLSSTGFNVISFGSSMLPDFLHQTATGKSGGTFALILGLILFLLVFVVVLRGYSGVIEVMRRRIENSLQSNASAESVLIFFGSLFVFSYLLGSNYDYRLVFLIPILAVLLTTDLSFRESCAGYFFALIIFYNSFLFRAEIGLISDLMLLFFLPFLSVLLLDICRRDLAKLIPISSSEKRNE